MRLRTVFLSLAIVIVPSNLKWHIDLRPLTRGVERQADSPPAPIPVVTGTAQRQDVSVYLFGLGTVQALNTVTVSSRVDGQLQRLCFEEGQEVHAGDVLAELDPRPFQASLRHMEANLRRDQAQLRGAQAELDRVQRLAMRDFASRQSVDNQRASVAQIEAAIEGDQAQIDNAKFQLEYATIRSPIDGRTGLRRVDEGNMIRASDELAIVVVAQIQPIAAVFALPEGDLPKVNKRLAAGAPPAVTAFDRDEQTVLAEGTLSTIDNVIDRKTGTFKLKVRFSNEKNTLWPGQFVNIRLHLATRQGGIVVPEAAVQRGPEGTYVFIITPNNTVEMRPIRVAQAQNGTALIDAGLSPGERVVVDGQYRLQSGTSITEVKPEGTSVPGRPDVMETGQNRS